VEVPVPAVYSARYAENVPLSSKFVSVAEELINFEEKVAIMQADNNELRQHHMMSVGYFMERAFDKVGRGHLVSAFDEWGRLVLVLRAERLQEQEQAARRKERQESKLEIEKLQVMIEQEQLKGQRLSNELKEEQERVELLRQENMQIASRTDRFAAQLQEAERCIALMQRAADLKVEAVRQDVLEYTSKSTKALLTVGNSPISEAAMMPLGNGSTAEPPLSARGRGEEQDTPRKSSTEVDELKTMVRQLRTKVSGIDAAVLARSPSGPPKPGA